MKLVIVIPSFYPAVIYGGPIFATLNAAKALSQLGVKVLVSSTDANGNKRLNIKNNTFCKIHDNLFVKYYKETIIGRFSWSLFKNIKNDIKDADVVHIQSIFSTPTPISLFYANIMKKPILLSPRGSLCKWCLKERGFYKKLWIKIFIKPFVKKVVWHATSKREKEDILNLFPKAKIAIITDGINTDEFKNFNRLSPKKFVKIFMGIEDIEVEKIVVSMGRLHKVKGFDILIKAFKKVLKSHPNSILCIAGKDDGDENRLKNLVKKLGLSKKVFFTGPLETEKKVDFLANADIFVLASHTENFGIVVAESLAAGTPVVASKFTPWETLEQYNCGHWVHNTPESLSCAINDILSKNKSIYTKNAKKLARNYEWSLVAKQFYKLFMEMRKSYEC